MVAGVALLGVGWKVVRERRWLLPYGGSLCRMEGVYFSLVDGGLAEGCGLSP